LVSILHKTGYNYGIEGASKYYNPFYVTYRGKGSNAKTKVILIKIIGLALRGINHIYYIAVE